MGTYSEELRMQDMVYQGTVLGPSLWNCFYSDVDIAVRSAQHEEIVFADDLNAMKEYDCSTSNDAILENTKKCQHQVHQWGKANAVAFDAGKESMHVIARTDATAGTFKLLGVQFDTKLIMDRCVHSLVQDCSWKLKSLLRTRRFLSGEKLINL